MSVPEKTNQSSERERAAPLAYLVTFTCYGTWLHGKESGSVDRQHRVPLTPFLAHDPKGLKSERSKMSHPSYELDAARRQIVLSAIREACAFKRWPLAAAHVRTNHVHLVMHTLEPPERVMAELRHMRVAG